MGEHMVEIRVFILLDIQQYREAFSEHLHYLLVSLLEVREMQNLSHMLSRFYRPRFVLDLWSHSFHPVLDYSY